MEKVIIDTDTAGDDTIAILTAIKHFKVEGITITGGNVDFDQEVENALYTVEVANPGYYIPVYKGYEKPMLAFGDTGHETVEDVHGNDGMGGADFEKAKQEPEVGHAVDFIIEMVKNNPNEISLLAIAPLTNIAMALQKEPGIAKDIPRLYIMGGINNSLGNITPAAEYNFYTDPEAAKIVLHSGIPITMVSWDMCTEYSLMYADNHQDIERMDTKGSTFFIKVNKVVKEFNKNVHKLDGTTHPDTLLVAVAANKKVMSKASKYYVDIETKGELTRGHNVVDVNGRFGKEPNVLVCEKVERSIFKDTLYEVLRNTN